MSTGRPLRADAQQNRDRLLDAAARAFARGGSEASLKAIAKDAGVAGRLLDLLMAGVEDRGAPMAR